MGEVAYAAELGEVLSTADEFDVKTAFGEVELREFAAGALGWSPAWVKALFGVRVVFAAMLRLDKPAVSMNARPTPEGMDFTPGSRISFFTVVRAEEGRYLLLEAADNHLTGYLALTVEPGERSNRLSLVTMVKYHRKAGRAYYQVIKPFHHLIVTGMVQAGARG
ncbi:DUF2867 domain-containing protein [Kribbella deserti]|uniref:DUF2867 domain-containing protein n=1 Tax=Kribbella deserti TaxID=1926257 RepID=A0ABV6QQU5_9ACTN